MENIEAFLKSHGYRYESAQGYIKVRLLPFLEVEVSKPEGRLRFEARTRKWTGFSGFVSLRLDTVLRLNTIGLFVMLIIGEVSKFAVFQQYDYTYIFIVAIALNLMWYFHTLIVFENFKSKVELVHFLAQKRD